MIVWVLEYELDWDTEGTEIEVVGVFDDADKAKRHVPEATLKKLYHDAPDKTIPFNQLMGMGIATIENEPMKLHELIHRSERGEEFTWEDRWLFFCGSYHAYETIIRDLQGE